MKNDITWPPAAVATTRALRAVLGAGSMLCLVDLTGGSDMGSSGMVGRVFRPLASRKVRVAVATVATAFAADYGLNVSEELVFTVLGVGVALILGIAHEDAGRAPAPVRRIIS
jgi:hypothetical protein